MPNQESIRSYAGLIFAGHFTHFLGACYPAHITALLRMDQIGYFGYIYYFPSRLFRDAVGGGFGLRFMSGPGDLITNPLWFSVMFYGFLGWIAGHVLDRSKRVAPQSREE